MGLEELMQKMSEREDSTPEPIHEAQIERLRELCAAYVADNPFKVGDLVTPRPGVNIRSAGRPHIVLETFPPKRLADMGCDNVPAGSAAAAARASMIVKNWNSGDYMNYAADHADFEPYTGPQE